MSSCDPQFFRTKFNNNKYNPGAKFVSALSAINVLLLGPVVVVVVVVVVVEVVVLDVVVTEQVFRSPLMTLPRPCRTALEDLHQHPVALLVKYLAVG